MLLHLGQAEDGLGDVQQLGRDLCCVDVELERPFAARRRQILDELAQGRGEDEAE